jgi:hypothetical protein
MIARARREKGVRPLFSKFFDSLQSGTVVGFNLLPGCLEHLSTRNNHDVYSCQWFMSSEELSNEPFRPVADDRVSYFLAGGNAEPGRADVIWESETGHESATKACPAFVDLEVFRPSPQFHRVDTVSRLRPFARRRLSTVRPFFVCMRTRKPCVRRRRRTLG